MVCAGHLSVCFFNVAERLRVGTAFFSHISTCAFVSVSFAHLPKPAVSIASMGATNFVCFPMGYLCSLPTVLMSLWMMTSGCRGPVTKGVSPGPFFTGKSGGHGRGENVIAITLLMSYFSKKASLFGCATPFLFFVSFEKWSVTTTMNEES